MATLNLRVDPTQMVMGAQQGEDALEDVAHQAQRTQSAVDNMARNVGRGAGAAGHKMKQLAQQGSQVVDMGIATGQWGKAFFLQMSDIAMVLGGPLTIAAGAAIGVLGTVGLSFITGGKAAKSMDDAVDDANDTLKTYIDLVGQTSGASTASFKEIEAAIRSTSSATKDLLAIAKIEAFASIDAMNASLADSVLGASLLQSQLSDVGDLLDIETMLRGNITVWKDNREQAGEFVAILESLGEGGPIEGMLSDAMALREEFKRNVDVTGEMTTEQLAFWKSLSQSIERMEVLVGTTEEVNTASQAIAEGYRNIARAQTTLNAEAREYILNMGEAFENASNLREELGDAAFEALRLSGVDMTSGIDSATKAAAQLATQLGVSVDMARVLAGLGTSVSGGRGQDPRKFDHRDTFRRQLADAQPTFTPVGHRGGGGSAAVFKEVEESIEAQESLFESLADVGGSALDRLIDGTSSLKDGLVDVAKEMLQVILKQQLMAKIGVGADGSTASGGVGSLLLQGLFGGFFDNGGLLATGQTGIVGENGPERITSTTRGTVVTSRAQTARQGGGNGGGVVMGEIGVTVDDDGKIQAFVKRMGIQSAQAGRALAVGDVRENLGSWNQTLNTDGALG